MINFLPYFAFFIAVLIVTVRSHFDKHTRYTVSQRITHTEHKEVTGVTYVYPKVPLAPRRAQTPEVHEEHTRITAQDIRTWIQNTREIDKIRRKIALT